MPGLPKLFFAPEDLGDQNGSGQNPGFSQENGHGEPAGADHPASPGPQAGAELAGHPDQPATPGRPSRQPWPGFGQRGLSRPVQRGSARPARQRPARPPDRELRHRALASLVLSILALVALFGLSGDLHRGVYLLIFSAAVGIGA